MNRTPAVSVVMPVYNAGPYLEDAVKSVFAQTFTDWELIVVDDASTDGAIGLVHKLDDPRVHVYRNERNMNQAASINRGVQLARAPLVALQDADDLSMPRRFERQVALLDGDSSLDVVSAGQYGTNIHLQPFVVDYGIEDHASIVRRPAFVVKIGHHTAMGRTTWWRRWPYDPRVRLCQDFDLFLRSYKESRFGNVPDPLYVYRFVGHTWGLRKNWLGNYYKMVSLLRHGFRPGLIFQTFLALASLPPRVTISTLMLLLHINPGMTRERRNPPTAEESRQLAEALAVIRSVQLPACRDAVHRPTTTEAPE